jgi:hypothetical protein
MPSVNLINLPGLCLPSEMKELVFCSESSHAKGSIAHRDRQYDTWQGDLTSALWAKLASHQTTLQNTPLYPLDGREKFQMPPLEIEPKFTD